MKRDKVERVRPETKRSAVRGEMVWWAEKGVLDCEMKRRLAIKDRRRSKGD